MSRKKRIKRLLAEYTKMHSYWDKKAKEAEEYLESNSDYDSDSEFLIACDNRNIFDYKIERLKLETKKCFK